MENIDTILMNAEEIKIAYAKRREENAKENKLRLRLHFWTKEEYRENSISKCSMLSCLDYLIIHPETLLATTNVGDSFDVTLSKKIFRLFKEVSNLDSRTLAMRTPSLSCAEIPEFINNIVEKSKGVHNYICLDKGIYKHIDKNCKDLVKNGAIQVFVDGKLHDCNTDIAYIKK